MDPEYEQHECEFRAISTEILGDLESEDEEGWVWVWVCWWWWCIVVGKRGGGSYGVSLLTVAHGCDVWSEGKIMDISCSCCNV